MATVNTGTSSSVKSISDTSPHAVRHDVTLLTDNDLYLFNEGTHHRLYSKLGAHPIALGGVKGVYFAVWAPNAERVSVMGDFNGWHKSTHPLRPRSNSGIWQGFVPGLGSGAAYKFHIESRYRGYKVDKADPFGFAAETPPRTASVICDLNYAWQDGEWMKWRHGRNSLAAPYSVYEVHLGSWRRVPEEGNRSLSYREMAAQLPGYVKDMGFTHVELMPVMEHPFYGSWGYQVTGYFATDAHGLVFFDGTHLFEHADPRKGFHPDWASSIFNYGRNEVQCFLISNALFWLDKYHADGLRVDAVASMLYLDYSRKGDWIPNQYGGRENLEAIHLLRRTNEVIYQEYPDVQMLAEESTSWPMVSRPTYLGGLGFGLKWDMGWMHDTLAYMSLDPVHRKYHHNQLTFRMLYAFTENFILPLSHDEVVHGKGSLLAKMPGDDWQKFANLRLLLGYMHAQPGKKLLFMGSEIGQRSEWYHEQSLDWHLLQSEAHAGIQRWVRDLNRVYRTIPAFFETDFDDRGFQWIVAYDSDQSVLAFLRRDKAGQNRMLVVCNFTPVPRLNYRLGVPVSGFWAEMLNSDAHVYGGSGIGNFGGVTAIEEPSHGFSCSLALAIPPLGVIFLKNP